MSKKIFPKVLSVSLIIFTGIIIPILSEILTHFIVLLISLQKYYFNFKINNIELKDAYSLISNNYIIRVLPFILTIFIVFIMSKHMFTHNKFQFNIKKMVIYLRKYLFGFILGMLCIIFILFFIILISNSKIFFNSLGREIFIILLFWVIQGFSEEYVYRGLLLICLSNKLNKKISIFINSLVFSFIHLMNPNIEFIGLINLFLFGIISSMLMIKGKSILLPASFHCAWNFTISYIFGVPVSGFILINKSIFKIIFKNNFIITGGKFGLEGSIITSIVLLCLIVLINYLNNNSLLWNRAIK